MSGSGGTVLRTVDGGTTWQNVAPPGAAGQVFRDIEAFSPDEVVLLAIGPGDASRVYRTEDGGATWAMTAQNADPAGFWDCMSFFDRHRGLMMGDPVGGKFQILSTSDGGRSWQLVPSSGMPRLPGEFGFAASGTCIETAGGRDAWFGTGGDVVSRVFHSEDRGVTWSVVETPVASAPAGGIFSLAFADRATGSSSAATSSIRRTRPTAPLHGRRRRDLGSGGRPGRVPLGLRLGASPAAHGRRGRPHGERRDDRRRPQLDALRHPQLRLGRVRADRGVLGVRRAGCRRAARVTR